ncbi:MAG: DbpA RNA binding domain-containing protein [Treponema sp.]|nr:DbpA RNA binding domain-containing protein [Treponema sp.]
MIFCATKVETDELARRLVEAGYPAEAIHGDLSQEIRERTLRRFRLRQHGSRRHTAAAVSAGGEPAILVATDVAARGLDIENLSHVINWDLPNDRETYVHRIGRTARAGKRGIAISLAALPDRSRIHQISRMMEKTLGSGIMWLKVPSVKAVMKALRRRISSTVVAALPEQETIQVAENGEPLADAALPAGGEGAETKETPAASPFLAKVCRNLIDQLGAERAVEALVSLSYGEYLDPDRYGPITEFQEEDFHEPVKAAGKSAGGRTAGGRSASGKIAGRRRDDRVRRNSGQHAPAGKRGFGREFREETGDFTRVYVGQGRQHGLGARDVANLLMRAGGIPGRLVDEIEMKDYCSFATLPADAAKRACAFSRKDQQSPVIRPAKP